MKNLKSLSNILIFIIFGIFFSLIISFASSPEMMPLINHTPNLNQKELIALPASKTANQANIYQALKLGYRDPDPDTLRNHDGHPSFFYLADSVYYVTRLTVPNYIASACTLKSIRFQLYRSRSIAQCLCSLLVWRDTVIEGKHQPGLQVFNGYYLIPSWSINDAAWINLPQLPTIITFNANEDFWLGLWAPTLDINMMSDGSENTDTTRNERKRPGQTWSSNRYDFMQEAIVSYTPLDTNAGVTAVENVEKILDRNDPEHPDTVITVKARVRNYGRTSLSPGIPIILQIDGPGITYMDTEYTQYDIARNSTELVTFQPVWQVPNVTGDYNIKAWSNLANDIQLENDTANMTTFVYTHGQRESFLAPEFPPSGWTVFNFNSGNEWERVTFTYYNDPNSAEIFFDPTPYPANNDWLITSCFKALPSDSIIFWYRAASSQYYETLLVRVNTNHDLDTVNFSVVQTVVTNDTKWQHCIIPLNGIISDSAHINVAFHYPCYRHFYIAMDEVIIPPPDTVFDFFTVSITAPGLPITKDSSYIPAAKFRNNSIGSGPEGVPVFYQIIGDSTFYFDSSFVGIDPGSTEPVKFNLFLPTVSETVLIKVWTGYANDENRTNDTIFKTVFIAPKFQSIPYVENFDENWGPFGNNPPLGGWRVIDNGQGQGEPAWNTNDWHKDTVRINSALIRDVAQVFYSPFEISNDRLISPRFDCSNPGTYILSFWHWYRDANPITEDSGLILISTNGGATWNRRIARYTNASDSGYKTFTISQYAACSSNVKICFWYNATNEYWWSIDDFSLEWIPSVPVLTYPPDNFDTSANYIRFTWSSVPGATNYVIQVAYDSDFQYIRTSDTVLTNSDSLDLIPTDYWWRVQTGIPYSTWSETRHLHVGNPPQPIYGWYQLASISPSPSSRFVGDGGALIFCALDSNIYLLKGNNTRDFYAYDIVDSVWSPRALIGLDTQITRSVKKGGAMCFGDTLLYAVKGNKSNEFWVYNPKTDTWIQKASVKDIKLYGGTGLVYMPATRSENKINHQTISDDNTLMPTENKIYLLAGGRKPTEPNFYCYDIARDTWSELRKAPIEVNSNKAWRDGSCLTALDGTIYALKGGDKYNYFYSYDIISDSWITRESIPRIDTLYGRKKKVLVKDGAAMTAVNGEIYAIKGGGTNVFWKYTPNADTGIWTRLDSIPRLLKRSVPKKGAALTSGFDRVYLIKGNITLEFWQWYPETTIVASDKKIITPRENLNINASPVLTKYDMSITLYPNPCDQLTTITYTNAKSEQVSLKLFDAMGRTVKIIHQGYLPTGLYHTNLSVKDLAPGVYFIGYRNTEKELITKLIIQ